jgi:hypothetical protein
MNYITISIIVDTTVFVNVAIHQVDAVYLTLWSPFLKIRAAGVSRPFEHRFVLGGFRKTPAHRHMGFYPSG